MRLFIAILLSDEIKKELTSAQMVFRKSRIGGNYSPEQNLHLTVAFIGEYSDPDRVLEVMEGVKFNRFPLGLEGFGAFDDLWWAGIERSDELMSYVRRLRRALSDAGIPFDGKRFVPHITLLRRAEGGMMPELPASRARMTVDAVSLMRSDRGKHSMIYTEIGRVEA